MEKNEPTKTKRDPYIKMIKGMNKELNKQANGDLKPDGQEAFDDLLKKAAQPKK